MSEPSLSLVAVGDLFIDRPEPAGAFAHFAKEIRQADIAFCNLEGGCSALGTPVLGKYITMRMRPDVIPALAEVGFNLVAFANNHVMDFGREAFVDTLDLLDKAGLPYLGAGRSLAEARQPRLFEGDGVRVATVGYATTVPWGYEATDDRAGIAPIRVRTMYEPRYQIMGEQPGTPATVVTEINEQDLEGLTAQVNALKEENDAVVVSLHWGVAYVPDPVGYQAELAHAVIDAGADMVLGHHAHVMQGVEIYKGRPIFYSLSQFVYDRNNPRCGIETFMVTARFGPDGLRRVAIRPTIAPVLTDPRPVREGERDLFKAQIERLSAGMNSTFTWEGDELVIG